ncbi:MAG: TonB-dependent receptor [Akkermansiaceae bacterium]|nr:TonB-dependent receptor [Akkermansiaceae bacterium]
MKRAARFSLLTLASLSAPVLAQDVENKLPEMVVMSQRREPVQAVLHEWTAEDIKKGAPRTLDELLSDEPSFSLYRRQNALFGNPTSAGVSLRNTGASAASRTLVLLDGIPQNDPFGGWLYWARYDSESIGSMRIVPAAQSVVWGNQSPAGVVQLDSPDPFVESHTLKVGAGSQSSYGVSTHNQMVNDDGSLAVGFSAFGFHTGGFEGIAEDQRGPIDKRLSLDAQGADLSLAWRPRQGLTIEPRVSWYTESRDNGTPLTGNTTEALDLSLRVTGVESDLTWQALTYYQHRAFTSIFSSVNATRTAETPSLNQFDVPGEGTGGAFTLKWEPNEKWTLNTGIDFRYLSGATNEEATFISGQFTRLRQAGGDQTTTGIFAAAGYRIDPASRIDLSVRGDYWSQDNGHRVERSLVNGSALRNEFDGDRDSWEPSASLAYTRDLTKDFQVNVSGGSTYRLPNLNELYRPYRVKNDIIEANPGLDPERFYSVEGGFKWQVAKPVKVEASVFHHTIKDAIVNVPVTDPDEISAIFGTIPAGGSGSQRRNVTKAEVTGAQGAIIWDARYDLQFRFDGIWTATRFSESKTQPLLVGHEFPQAPDLRLIGSTTWKPCDKVELSAGVEYGSRQFDDALGQRKIPSYWTARLGSSWEIVEGITAFARLENLFDAEIATGQSTDGIRSVAAPRSLWAGVEWKF